MGTQKILTRYVSEIDQFLQQFDKQHPEKTLSQQKEIAKHQRVYSLRDNPDRFETPIKLWDEF